MKCEHISKSRIECYSTCPLAYHFKYESDKKSKKHDFFEFGSLVHAVMEKFNEGYADGEVATLDIMLQWFKDEWGNWEVEDYDYFEKGETILKDYLDNFESYVKKGWKIEGVEKEFDFILPNGVPVKGVFDVVYRTGDMSIEIVDYKTSKYAKTQEEIGKDIQVQLYYLAAQEMYPEDNVEIAIHNLLHGKTYAQISRDSISSIMNYLEVQYNMISSDIQHLPRVPDSKCKWCDYSEYCEAYQGILNGKAIAKVDSVVPANLDKATEAYYLVQKQIKVLEQYKEKISNYITECMKRGDITQMEFNDGDSTLSIKTAQKATNVYDFDTVREVFDGKEYLDLSDVVTIKKTAVDKVLKDEPELLKKIQSNQRKKFSNAYLSTPKKKKND